MKIVICILAWVGMATGLSDIEQAKASYLNKQVVIKNSAFRYSVEVNGRYQLESAGAFLPADYVGRTATVIAIQPHEVVVPGSRGPEKVNALGEVIKAPPPEDQPWFDIVVKFENGKVAMLRDTLSGAAIDVMFAEVLEAEKKIRDEKVAKLIGRNLYATALSTVYRADVTLSEMQDRNRVPVPFMEPLRIAAAKWSSEAGCVIVRLEVPHGGSVLALITEDGKDCSDSRLEAEFPTFFSQLDIAAIKSRSIVRGMSSLALYYAIGHPESENDWGRGGKQLIYKSNLIVYLSTEDKVEDWQKMHD